MQLSISKLPDYRIKQKILYIDKTGPETLKNCGDLFFAEGNLSDALDFYAKADFTEGMQKIKTAAGETGDTMLFQRAAKALNWEPAPADWENLAKAALDLKKYLFARHALEKTHNEELLQSLQKIMQAEEHVKIS